MYYIEPQHNINEWKMVFWIIYTIGKHSGEGFAVGADSPHWDIKKPQNCCPTLLYMWDRCFEPLSIMPMLTCRQTCIFGTTYNRSQWYELLMSEGNMYYGGQKWGKSNRIEIFRQIFRFFTRLLDYYLYLCLNYLPTNCQDG